MEKGKLIVLAAFDKNDDGELVPAFDPRQVDNEDRAKRDAKMLALRHVGVIAWSRDGGNFVIASSSQFSATVSSCSWRERSLFITALGNVTSGV